MEQSRAELLRQLVRLSRHLGRPQRDYVILGDGNTSVRTGPDSYLVKASGVRLHCIGPEGFVELRLGAVLELLERGPLADADITAGLKDARLDGPAAARPSIEAMPSIEATLHALVLTLGGAQFAGHTHPVAWMSILCSQGAEAALAGRIFTEEILYCGAAPAFVPYADPGLPLALLARDVLRRYLDDHGAPPQVILLQNHGLIALGGSAVEVENVTAMSVKAARVLLGTYALGGPRFLSHAEVARVVARPDERYRRDLAGRS